MLLLLVVLLLLLCVRVCVCACVCVRVRVRVYVCMYLCVPFFMRLRAQTKFEDDDLDPSTQDELLRFKSRLSGQPPPR